MFTFSFIFEGLLIYGAYRTLVNHSMSLAQLAVLASMMVSSTMYFIYNAFRYQFIIFLEHTIGIKYILYCAEYHEPFWKALLVIGIILIINMIPIIPDILRNLNLTISAGERIAIVGYNGAGKTTLIKLLMRLYDPTNGSISYHGTDVKNYNLDDYHHRIGVVFQDYKMYGASVLENVILDDIPEPATEEEAVTNALVHSGFPERLQTLPNGLSTQITTEFDDKGVNLWGGESQKVAIARGAAC